MVIMSFDQLVAYVDSKPFINGRKEITVSKGHYTAKNLPLYYRSLGYRVTTFYSTYSVTYYIYLSK
jgi:hypothetical protein